MKKTNVIIIVVLLFISNACVGICLNNSTPEVPIYPESILVEEIFSGSDFDPNYQYHYTSTASLEEIVNFYTANKAWCRQTIKTRYVCTGDAEPYGSYSVRLRFEPDESESLTKYSIDLFWNICGEDFVEPI